MSDVTGALEPGTSGQSAAPGQSPSRAPRLSFVAALVLALTALGVSAVFRLNQDAPLVQVASSAIADPRDREDSAPPSGLDRTPLEPVESLSESPLALEQESTSTRESTSTVEVGSRDEVAARPVATAPRERPVAAEPTAPGQDRAAPPPASPTSAQQDDLHAGEMSEPVPMPGSASSVATTTAAPPAAVILTPVTILYKHKGGRAFLSIKLDGVRVWSQDLKPVAGRRQKWTGGYESRAVVPVSPGTHTLEISLRDPDRGIEAATSIRSRYTNGRKRTLRVTAEPKANALQLRWKE